MPDTPNPSDPHDAAESSGSRWEQDDTALQPTEGATDETASPSAAPEPVMAPINPPPAEGYAGQEPAARIPTPWARRIGLAGAAAALVAVGGAGGFALGHATSGDGDRFQPTSFQVDRDGDGDRHGFDDGDGRGPGDGFGTDGDGFPQPPGEGELPQAPDGTDDDSGAGGSNT